MKLDTARRIPHLDVDLSLIDHDRLVVHIVLGGSVGLRDGSVRVWAK